MKAMREWGYDLYRVPYDIEGISQVCKRNKLQVFDLWMKDGWVYFYAPVMDRRVCQRVFSKGELLRTTGIIGFLFSQMRKPRRIIALVISILTIVVCSNLIYSIQLRGSSTLLEQKIKTYLTEQNIKTPMRKLSTVQFRELEQDLKEHFFEEIEWINLRNQGSAYFIDYVGRVKASVKPKSSQPLIAYKSGVIARFDVKRGVKVVKEFDFVKEGDILVTSDLLDSKNEVETTYVEGAVYAYTQTVIEAQMKENRLTAFHKSFAFFQLLFDCRLQISKELQEDETIETENILQFEREQGTIKMKIQYTLFENITHP